ncbi:Hypothetical predicted protein [Xyrichtys novacula]|uniref:Centromere protein P n=1 Tax=Xyrichtys novacula TaxID=13765 RepID=A0AAV1ETL5_XYRNO|nr:Hypothetical predicted protein [Xyrichtys novacula]
METMNEENMEEARVLETQIERLQAEVEALQRQQQENHKDITLQLGGQIQDATSHFYGLTQEEGEEKVMFRLKEEVEELEEDLKWQTKMNGIFLNSCTTKTLQNSGSKLVQQFSVSGQCSELAFQVEFLLTEVKNNQQLERTVSDLNVAIEAGDQQDLKDLSIFMSGVEDWSDLLLFFRTLRTFSDRCDDRDRTFEHFQDKYPDVVSFLGDRRSEVMALSHPELPGCGLLVHWSVKVSSWGEVTPKINLLTKIPEKALQLFPSEALGGADEAFESLLRILGPEAALESVIRAISLSEES